MGRRTNTAMALGCVAALLLSAGGCTVSVQPWTKPTGGPNVADSGVPGLLPVGFQGQMQRPGGAPTPAPAVNNEIFVQLTKQFNEADDHRKALLEQVQTLKKQVKDREDNLRHATYEIEESSTKLKHTREEFRQWETEMNELRERVKKLEDNRRAVGQLIEEILNHLERPREPLRLPIIEHPLKKE